MGPALSITVDWVGPFQAQADPRHGTQRDRERNWGRASSAPIPLLGVRHRTGSPIRRTRRQPDPLRQEKGPRKGLCASPRVRESEPPLSLLAPPSALRPSIGIETESLHRIQGAALVVQNW